MSHICFSPPRPYAERRRSRCSELELPEARSLLSFTSVLVNNPVEHTSKQDTQSETAIALGASSDIVVAYNDDGGPSPSYLQRGGDSLSTNDLRAPFVLIDPPTDTHAR